MINYHLLAVILMLLSLTLSGQSLPGPDKLWYDKPASRWEETLPLGNGRLGMMPDGGVEHENVVLNDITLWSGSPQDANNYDAYQYLPAIRRLLLEGKNEEAQKLVDAHFICRGPGSGGKQWGCFQVLGNLHLEFAYPDGKTVQPGSYHRELRIDEAVARSSYKVDGVHYEREYFASFGDDVCLIRLKAGKKGKLNVRVGIDRPERFETRAEGNELQLSGQLDNGTDGKGMQYISRVRAQLVGGGSQRSAGKTLVIENATEAILFISSATNFRDAGYVNRSAALLQKAMEKSYALQLKEHLAHYQPYYNRLSLNLGGSGRSGLPTDKRLEAFQLHPEADNAMAALFYQYGRYLSISSTRLGLLPPNLQGLWANQVQTPWNGDYHLDVNVQMNHWQLGEANLGELGLPLVELVRGLTAPGSRTAKAYYQAEGWVAHVITNVWGYTAPGESASWGVANAGSGWLCSNLWDYWAFSADTSYLKTIYPILKGSAKFYSSVLMADPETGWLVTGPSVSPENSFELPNGQHANVCMGPTIDNQITRELFGHVIEASEILGLDNAFRDTLLEKVKHLPPVAQIAKDGRIMEWLKEYTETDPQHRHISHLYGVFPAGQISPGTTPELAKAARKSLLVRGDDGPSWAIAYKFIFWARLLDGEHAYKMLKQLLTPRTDTTINYGAGGGTYANLFTAGPPFQIDGNFGGGAAIGEMLLQSHNGYIELLPAIPKVWQARGKISGFKARGNFTVDMDWKDGKVLHYRISSPHGRSVQVKVNGHLMTIKSKRQGVWNRCCDDG